MATLLTIAKLTRALNAYHLEKIGLAIGQDELLDAVVGSGQLQVREIAERLNVRPSTISKMVERLAEAGYVVRSKNRLDGRAVLISATDAGVLKQKEVIAARRKIELELLTTATPNGSYMEITELHKLASHLSSRLRRIR